MKSPKSKKSEINKRVASFLKDYNRESILKIINEIGNQSLTPTSHLYPYKKYDCKTLKEAGVISAKVYSKTAKNCPPLALIDVVLASGRSYNNIVKDSILTMKKSKHLPFIKQKTFQSLKDYLIQEKHLGRFYKKYIVEKVPLSNKAKAIHIFVKDDLGDENAFIKDVLNFNDSSPKKMFMLLSMLDCILELKRTREGHNTSDYQLMSEWAENKSNFENEGIEDESMIKKSLGENINFVGAATIQHLRMHFGADTFKPDQRVKEVLLFNFLKLNKAKYASEDLTYKNAFKIMSLIKTLVGDYIDKRRPTLVLDSMFVNYGSGYYNKHNEFGILISQVFSKLIYKLKERKVSKSTIQYATGYSKEQISILEKSYISRKY